MGYDQSITPSGNAGFLESLDLNPSNVNIAINDVRDFMELHGWTNTGGTQATTSFIWHAVPFRVGSGGPPQHSGPISGYLGVYGANTYQLWDPGANSPIDSDPTGGGVVGVQLGTSPDDTINNFASQLAINDGYVATFLPWNGTTATGTATFALNGPGGNIDEYSIFRWLPANIITSTAPKKGGWYMQSSATVLNDQLTIWVREEFFDNFTITTTLNDQECPTYEVMWSKYRMHAGPHQFSLQKRADSSLSAFDGAGGRGGGAYLIASALAVPSAYFAESKTLDTLAYTMGAQVQIVTLELHEMIPGEILWLTNVLPTTLRGRWYVASVVDGHTVTITRTVNGVPYVADGATASINSGSFYKSGVFGACFQGRSGSFSENSYVEKTGANLRSDSLVNGEFLSVSMSGRIGALSAMMPTMNVRDRVDGVDRAGHVIRQAPYFAFAGKNDEETRVAGILWDAFVELQRNNYEDVGVVEGKRFMCWMQQDPNFNPLTKMGLWIQAEDD